VQVKMRDSKHWWQRVTRRDRRYVEEYLYIDNDRLSAYVDQLRAPVAYDKVPVWSAELNLQGPTAKAEQSRVSRPYTSYEQIAFL
jgi:hypothetical protein